MVLINFVQKLKMYTFISNIYIKATYSVNLFLCFPDDAVVTGILVPLLLVLSLVGVLGYLGRRYNWPGRARTLAQRMMAPRRTNDVLIRGPDDDDDPIA